MERGTFRPTVVSWDDILDDPVHPGVDPAFYNQFILAEGDSWFTLAGIPTSNLLWSMRFHKRTMIVNCGRPGDTIKCMSDIENNRNFRQALMDKDIKWDLVLMSGGGNDLIDQAKDVIKNKNERGVERPQNIADYCDQQALDNLISRIQDGYKRIFAFKASQRDAQAQEKPVVLHTYDYATPRNAPARFFTVPVLGPWLFKAMRAADVHKDDRNALTDYLIDHLAQGLLALADQSKKIHVVDTRGLLIRASQDADGEDGDWINEIHPDHDGYSKIAKQIDITTSELLNTP